MILILISDSDLAKYIHHITLTTGHVSRVVGGEVSGETLARVRPWIAAMLDSGAPMPLPVSALADDYSAHASAEDGALLVTVSGPSGLPMVTIGVAARSRHAVKMWADLVALSGASAPDRPSTPWCAVVLWPALGAHMDAAGWLGDLERCVSWAWCNRE